MGDTEESSDRNVEDLAAAIREARLALDTVPDDDILRARHLRELGLLLSDRYYLESQSVSDIEDAIQLLRRSINMTPEALHQAAHLSYLADCLYHTYGLTGSIETLDEAIALDRRALEITPDEYNRAIRLHNLGAGEEGDPTPLYNLSTALIQRYCITNELEDLIDSIRLGRQNLVTIPEGVPEYERILYCLGIGLYELYITTQAEADLEEAIHLVRQATGLTIIRFDDCQYRITLASLLCERYIRMGIFTDLEEAIVRVGRQAVEMTPHHHPDLPWHLCCLAFGLNRIFFHTAQPRDLEEAIDVSRLAVTKAPLDHAGRPFYLTVLSIGLHTRYNRTGRLLDLYECIDLGMEAFGLSLGDAIECHYNRMWCTLNLARYFEDKYLREGVITDLDRALKFRHEGEQTVGLSPLGSRDRPHLLLDLGNLYHTKYYMAKILYYLETAIQTYKEALETWPECDSKADIYRCLGSGYRDKFLSTGTDSIFELGINAFQAALDSTTRDSSNRGGRILCLADHYHCGFKKTRKATNLDNAVQLSLEAFKATSQHDRYDYTMATVAVGELHLARFGTNGLDSDLETATDYLEEALFKCPGVTNDYILIVWRLITVYTQRRDWFKAWKVAADLITDIRLFLPSFFEYREAQNLFPVFTGLASIAAALALSSRAQPIEALQLLENGRGIMAVILTEQRLNLPPWMAINYPELPILLDKVEAGRSLEISKLNSGHQVTLCEQIQQIEAGRKLDTMISKISTSNTTLAFRSGLNSMNLDLAVKEGPVVVINLNYRCDAFLVTRGDIQVLPLPGISKELIEKKVAEGNLGELQALEWLWETITGPILDALGFTETPSDNNWPHVWWIPIGALSRLPLHAAGRHTRHSGETVIDRVVSSYSRSIHALIEGHRDPLLERTSVKARALVVDMEHTPESADLPFASREIEAINEICESIFEVVRTRRCTQDVMSHLGDCDIFHFAGHGYTDAKDPSASHLRLEDWKDNPLRVADLLQMNLRKRKPFLAYLSACSTSQIRDAEYLDEGAHLLSACQLAGFRHAIGTMWEVNDKTCVDVARIVYEEIREKGLTDESVWRGLHKASIQLRDLWLNAGSEKASTVRTANSKLRVDRDVLSCEDDDLGPAHWVPYVHYGV
ncbi:CHAT domain-containing protein [Xylariaceae sp. AK1471]|nr:CHAT domain-containing protein [Xylariaceae sp. AK1471]